MTKTAKAGATFFPLTVEYTERYYATGKIGGNKFSKREARPSETAILNSRLIDRPIRPLFPKGVQNEVQIIATILSSSGESDYGFWGILGASLSLQLAGVIGFEGPTAGVRIVLTQDGEYVFDPSFAVLATARLDLTIAGTRDAITMVEAGAHEVSDTEMLGALEYAHSLVRELCDAQEDFLVQYRASHMIPVLELVCVSEDEALAAQVEAYVTSEMMTPLFEVGKMEFHDALETLENTTIAHITALVTPEEAPSEPMIRDLVYDRVKYFMRAHVLERKTRLDGRAPAEVRPLRSTVAVLPRTHGSGLFERGMTQVLSVATLGGPGDIQIIDDLYAESTKRYVHHYNFPPYSVGEVRMLR